MDFASLAEKGPAMNSPVVNSTRGRRSLRTLPFSQDTFRLIIRKFYVHNSIAKAISRADIPLFSSAQVEMGEPEDRTYSAHGELHGSFPRPEC